MAVRQDTTGLANPLVDPLEPAFNGGLLNPLLAWAGAALPDRMSMSDTPASVLHRVVSADVNRTDSDSLESVFKAWLSGRLHSHVAYFALSGGLLLVWLFSCCCLFGITLCRERHRRARLRRILLVDGDQVDAATGNSGGVQLPTSQYRRFGTMLIRRVRDLRRSKTDQTNQSVKATGNTQSGTNASSNVRIESNNNNNNNGSHDLRNQSNGSRGLDLTDSADPWSIATTPTTTEASSPARTAATEVFRAAHLSKKTLSGRDRRLLVQTGAAAVASLLCVGLLVAYCTQADGIVALASTERGANSARSIVSATVGHLDRFLTRSLAESNRTIIDTFESAYPAVEKLFMDFGTELLDLLMSDYGIDKLIGHLEYFLATVNGTVNAMRDIASARETVIKPLQQFSAQLQVHRDSLHDPLRAVCNRFGSLFPAGHCASLVTRLTELRLGVNDTKLETDSSVAIVTLLNKMVKLDIDNVQKQVEKAKESLSTGLQAISGVIRQLLDGLVDTVSSQFEQAEFTIADVKAGFDRAARDPDLWDAVETAGKAVLILVILSCIVFLLTCALCCILLWALARYLRTACQLDQMPSAVVVAVPTHGRTPVELSANSSPLRRSSASSTTSGFSSSGFSNPRWSPRFADRGVEMEVVEHEESFRRFSSRRKKLRRLHDREWKGFTYCCAFDCSIALLVGALILLLPLLFSLALFYATGELQVDACRYLASPSGNRIWDARLDEFTKTRLWPLVQDALDQRSGLPISLPNQPPSSLIEKLRGSCGDPNATLFSVFGLTGLLNATELLSSNLTQSQFLSGASLIKEQINATDANALIPPELDSLTSVLPQLASLLDAEDYAASIAELHKPLLVMPQSDVFIVEVGNVVSVALAREPSNSDAVILRHSLAQLNASMLRSEGIEDRLSGLRRRYQLLQDSRNFTGLTTSLLTALQAVQATLADKQSMLTRVDAHFEPCLARHQPLFANFLDPLASGLLASVGHCDDLRLALETLSVDLCSNAAPRANLAAFLLLLTTCFFAVLFGLSWWLLVRIGRHQAAVLQFEVGATSHRNEKHADSNEAIVQKVAPGPEAPIPPIAPRTSPLPPIAPRTPPILPIAQKTSPIPPIAPLPPPRRQHLMRHQQRPRLQFGESEV